MRNTVIGILAHVDAGKTTLSESILYRTGTIRQHGRVDHGDAFLDTDAMEKKRGITIYSKLARFRIKNRPFIILDTPGHADFSPEMERALRVMDDAVLVISAADVIAQGGADPQVKTLWRLLQHYHVPTFLFINKMDQLAGNSAEAGSTADNGMTGRHILSLLQKDLGNGLVFFGAEQLSSANEESVAVCQDELMERVLDGGHIDDDDVRHLISGRLLFPVYWGSALLDQGTDALLEGLFRYAVINIPADSAGPADQFPSSADDLTLSAGHPMPEPQQDVEPSSADHFSPFGAIVYKITHEGKTRLTWMKITHGTLSIRDSVREPVSSSGQRTAGSLRGADRSAAPVTASDSASSQPDSLYDESDHESDPDSSDGTQEEFSEKVSEIRLYSGERFTAVTTVPAGDIAAVAGLSRTRAGDGLGVEETSREEILTPIQTSRVTATDLYGKPVDDFTLMKALRGLEEQEPMLAVSQDEETHDITVRIMGQVQIEILKDLLRERYGLRAEFGQGTIVYMETIRRPVEGVGHFEPLRHYAEVHLMLEPGEPGSGLVFENHCPPDTLDRNWQNLVMTHLQERQHKGVLTGSAITDMRISLIGGKASRKHTSGGDFRRATYAAVRQGLMMAENILLEPVLEIRMEIPSSCIGRAMTDITRMHGSTQPAEFREDGMAVLEGSVPASEFGDYPQTVAGYTGGSGSVSVSLKGYEPCHNAREVIDERGYDPDLDRRNPTWSVFCSHGAGTVVPWDRVRDFMQAPTGWTPDQMDRYDGPILTDDFYTFSARNTEEFVIDRGEEDTGAASQGNSAGRRKDSRDFKEKLNAYYAGEEELRRIFEKTYGPIKRNLRNPENERYYTGYESSGSSDAGITAADQADPSRSGSTSRDSRYNASDDTPDSASRQSRLPHSARSGRQDVQEFLLVDGYNIIFAWEELKELAAADIKAARDRLLDILSDYAGYSGLAVIVVFDAYRVPGGRGEVCRYNNIDVVFTKEAETADLYIEKTAHRLSKNHRVTVATGDQVEQVIIFGSGALRLSPRGLLENILLASRDMRERFLSE